MYNRPNFLSHDDSFVQLVLRRLIATSPVLFTVMMLLLLLFSSWLTCRSTRCFLNEFPSCTLVLIWRRSAQRGTKCLLRPTWMACFSILGHWCVSIKFTDQERFANAMLSIVSLPKKKMTLQSSIPQKLFRVCLGSATTSYIRQIESTKISVSCPNSYLLFFFPWDSNRSF